PRENEKAPQRNELCPVPFYRFKDDFLRQRKKVYRWDILEHRWMLAEADIVCPGQVFLIPPDQGGDVPHIGWEPKSIIPVPPVPSPSLQPLEGNDDDLPSQDIWQTIAEHSKGVVAETESSADAFVLHGELRQYFIHVERYHVRGG